MKNKYKQINKIKPFIIFFTGLNNSGKSTLSKLLKSKLNTLGYKNIKNIDGDIFRKKIKNFFYDKKSRNLVGSRKLKLARKLLKKGFIVIVSGVAPDKKWRQKKKKNIKNLFFIYLKCSFKESLRRNKIKNKNFFTNKINLVGKNQKYEQSNDNDIIINTEKLSQNKSINKIINFFSKKKLI